MSFPNLTILKIWMTNWFLSIIDYKNQQMKRNDKFHYSIYLDSLGILDQHPLMVSLEAGDDSAEASVQVGGWWEWQFIPLLWPLPTLRSLSGQDRGWGGLFARLGYRAHWHILIIVLLHLGFIQVITSKANEIHTINQLL